MRKIISIVIALVIASIPLSSAYADDYNRHYNEDDVAAGVILGLGLAIIGGAIISSANAPSRQYDYYPEPQLQNRWNDNRRHSEQRWNQRRPQGITCTRNIGYDRYLGYVDQQTGRPCL